MLFQFSRWPSVSVSMALVTVLATTAVVSKGLPQNASSPPLTVQQFNGADSTRERGQRASDILKAMTVSGGDWVADVGAGNGYYSQRLSEVVGPTGRVFAEDISDYMIGFLNGRIKLFDLKNVEPIKGDDDNPKLPASSLAAVLIVDSYHHFTQYQAMSEQILLALKPGGRLVIADYSLAEHRGQPRAEQLKLHEIDPGLVRAELEPIGIQVLKCEDPFVKRIAGLKGSSTERSDLWLIIAERPKR